MTAVSVVMRRPLARFWEGRTKYLLGAVCLVICVVMVLPIVLSVLASVKNTAEAAAVPPTYFPHELSTDSYQRLYILNPHARGYALWASKALMTRLSRRLAGGQGKTKENSNGRD